MTHVTLVTGVGGFVGSRLVEAIYHSDFGHVRGGIRRWANASRSARNPIEYTPCDIMNSEETKTACQGASSVVHCAYSDDLNSIVEGTRNMLQGAYEANIDRFVYISSAEVYGRDVAGVVDETYECKPTGNGYGDAKLEAENLVGEYQQKGLATTILRPSIIYGPFSQSWTIDLANRLQSGKWGIFDGHGEGICNLVHVDDLIRAILISIEHPAAAGQTFNIVGNERPTWNEYFAKFNDALELPPLQTIDSNKSQRSSFVRDQVNVVTSFFKSKFEEPLMRIYLKGGKLSDMMKWLRDHLKSTPTASELQGLYSRTANFCGQKSKERIGFHPQVPLEEGLHMCKRWLAFHGYLQSAQHIFPPSDS